MAQPSAEQTHPALQMLHLTSEDAVMILVGLAFIYLLYFTLSKKLFGPLLAHLEHREGVTAGAVHTADQMRQKGRALRARYDEGLFQARLEANRKKNEILADAKKIATETVGSAEAAAAKELQAGRAAIANQIQEAQGRIESEAKDLAQKLASTVDAQLAVH